MDSEQYHEAISQYTAAMSLQPVDPQRLLMKRSNAWVGYGAWQDALNDAKEWVESKLTSGSWRNALPGAVDVSLPLPWYPLYT